MKTPISFKAKKKDPKKIKVNFYSHHKEVLKLKAKQFFEKCPWCGSPISFVKHSVVVDYYDCSKCGGLEYECDEEKEE